MSTPPHGPPLVPEMESAEVREVRAEHAQLDQLWSEACDIARKHCPVELGESHIRDGIPRLAARIAALEAMVDAARVSACARGLTTDRTELCCSFCGEKPGLDRLVAGPLVYICGLCVDVARVLLSEGNTPDRLSAVRLAIGGIFDEPKLWMALPSEFGVVCTGRYDADVTARQLCYLAHAVGTTKDNVKVTFETVGTSYEIEGAEMRVEIRWPE